MNKPALLRIVLCVVICCVAVAPAAQFFSDRGSAEIGGALSFTSINYEGGNSVNVFALSPTLNFFPVKSFMLGPIIDYVSSGGSSEFGIGARAGLVFPAGTGYISFGSGYEHISSSGSSIGINNIPVFIVYKGVVHKHISINYQPQMNFENDDGHSIMVFSFNIGVTGLLF